MAVDTMLEKPNIKSDEPEQLKEQQEKDGGFGDYIRIFHYADKYDWCLNAVAFIACIGSGTALPLTTLVFGESITEFNSFSAGSASSSSGFQSTINRLALFFVYLFVAKFFLTYIATVCISITAMRTTRNLRRKFLEHTLRLHVWHFDAQSNGATATQITTNGNRINQGIAEKLVLLITGMATFVASFAVALSVQWKLALITMSIIPAIFIITGGCVAIDSIQEARIVKMYSRASSLAVETLASIRTVHAFWAQDKMLDHYDAFLEQAHKEGNKKSPTWGVLFSTEYFCVYAGTALCFWQGFRMYQSGEIDSAGTVFTVVFSTVIAATSISTIAPQIQSFTNAASGASELFGIIDKPSLLDPMSSAGERPDSCEGEIEIKDLNFSYPSRPQAQILHDFSLSIPAGKTTALVGASGSGKSSLVGLIERWYLPTSGTILVDNRRIEDYNVQWLRSQVRLVQQEPTLYSGTVFENVAKGFSTEQHALPREKQYDLVREACRSTNAHDFIQELPNGYETQVGERAGMLSGGQRQRVSIARSIISNPKILLLDEATSALDPQAERIVQDALDRVSINRTTLVIAHKLATIMNADNIAVISKGHIVEQGTHQELIARRGQYAALVAAQDLGEEEADADAGRQDSSDDEDKTAELSRPVSIQRTQTNASNTAAALEAQTLTTGTLNYSLVRCLWIMLGEQKSLFGWYTLSTVGCLIGGATYPAQAILFSRLLNVFILPEAEAREQANFYSLMFFVVAIGNFVAYFTIGWACNIIGQTVTHRYRKEMYQRVLSQDMAFFDRPENTSGALTSKLSSLPTQLQELISGNILLIFVVLVNLLSSSVLALVYGWKLGLVMVFGGLPLLVLSGYVRIRLDTRLEAKVGERFAASAGLASEAVTSIRTVASLTLEPQVLAEYNERVSSIVLDSIRSLLFTFVPYALSQSVDFLVQALGFWYGAKLLGSGEYTLTQFYIIFIGVLFAGQAAGQFFSFSTSITKAAGAANYILWLRTLQPVMVESSENKNIGPSSAAGASSSPGNRDSADGPIELSNISFRYPQRDASRVLRGISMDIPAGSSVAFVGASGCGKSTLISLLQRFYDPTSGEINLSSTNIACMNPRLYRNHLSLVQQEPILYQGSVRDNIVLGLPSDKPVSDAEIEQAARAANAWDFVSSLPEGLSTSCGTRGLQFSGGQRQRIAIARALIRNPRVLLLDEATSALDTQSERIVQKALDAAGKEGGRTTVAVAHRLSTIRDADRIYVFANGRIAEAGTHQELQRARGRYFEMCQAQGLDQGEK